MNSIEVHYCDMCGWALTGGHCWVCAWYASASPMPNCRCVYEPITGAAYEPDPLIEFANACAATLDGTP